MPASKNSSGKKNEIWTVLRIIRWTTGYLEGKGVDSPRLDAEVLLADLLKMRRIDLYVNYDRPLSPDELAGYREMVKRRAAREPAAYIIGRKEFYSLDFKVSSAVLIPRPETETLVDEAVDLARKRFSYKPQLKLADIGTGSGAVAISLASELKNALVWAVDISERALDVARVNIEGHKLEDRVNLIRGDLLEPLLDIGEKFDIITANPPYVPLPAFNDMEPEVRDWEPHLALAGGEDGLLLIRRLVSRAVELLASNGALLLEVWHEHAPELRRLGEQYGFGRTKIVTDLSGRDRVAVFDKIDRGTCTDGQDIN